MTRIANYDIDLEQKVLGACFSDGNWLSAICAELSHRHFYDPFHARLFETIQRRLGNGGSVNIVAIASLMKSDPDWQEAGEDGYLSALQSACPINPALADYIRILKDFAARRDLAAIGQDLIDGVSTDPAQMPTEAICGDAMDGLLLVGATRSRQTESPCTVAARVLDRADEHLHGVKPKFVTTGLKRVDHAIGGLQATDFLTICARAGMGKTAMLRKLTLSAARAGNPVLFFSKEMSSDQLVQAMLCDIDYEIRGKDTPPIQTWKFRAGCLSNYEIGRLRTAQKVLDGLPLEICDDGDLTMQAIFARSRAFQNRHKGKLGLVAVDFLQIVGDDGAGKTDSREQVVTRLAYAHKRMAKMLEWVVAAAVQLKNKGDGKSPSDRLPTEEDVRESGGVIMASDISIALHRPAFFLKQKQPTVPKERDEYREWLEKYREVEHDLAVRGFKNRHGDPCALNLDLWADMASSAIRDERPGRFRLGDTPVEDEELQF